MARILIVEDETDIANAFKKQLELIGGYDVDLADSGEEGLAIMKAVEYDVVLLDLSMRNVDGLSVLEELSKDAENEEPQQIYYHSPIMILTNVTSGETKAEVRKFGIPDDRYVVKSNIRSEELLAKVRGVIGDDEQQPPQSNSASQGSQPVPQQTVPSAASQADQGANVNQQSLNTAKVPQQLNPQADENPPSSNF